MGRPALAVSVSLPDHRLVGLVVKASGWRAPDLGSIPACAVNLGLPLSRRTPYREVNEAVRRLGEGGGGGGEGGGGGGRRKPDWP